MAPRNQPTPEDRRHAIQIVLAALASGQDTDPVLDELAALHVRHNTFPAEELLELASDCIDESRVTTADPIDFASIRDRFLPEHRFSGKNQHYKSRYAITAAPGRTWTRPGSSCGPPRTRLSSGTVWLRPGTPFTLASLLPTPSRQPGPRWSGRGSFAVPGPSGEDRWRRRAEGRSSPPPTPPAE